MAPIKYNMTTPDDLTKFDVSRREWMLHTGLSLAAVTSGFVALPATSAETNYPSCIITPSQTEGPYFVDELLLRSDLRGDPSTGLVSAGVPLALTLRILSAGGSRCVPVADALVDLWHCDAAGLYSDATDPHFNTVGKKFLRGFQLTNPDGKVEFVTVYPGWYPGRAVHLHVKIRLITKQARNYQFTSQLYFNESVTDQVHAQAPYAQRPGRRLRNPQDGIFREGGDQLLLTPQRTSSGYAARFDIGLSIT